MEAMHKNGGGEYGVIRSNKQGTFITAFLCELMCEIITQSVT